MFEHQFFSTVDALDMLCAISEREKLSSTIIEPADRTSTKLMPKKNFADQTPSAIPHLVQLEADPQLAVSDHRRHIVDPVGPQVVEMRKTELSDLPRR